MLHIYKLSTFNLAPHLSLHLYYKIMLNHINHDSDTHPKGFDSSTYSCQWMNCTYMCCQWYACQVNWWERDHIYMKEARMTRTLGQWTGGIHEKWPMNITYNVLHHQWTNFNTVNICWKKKHLWDLSPVCTCIWIFKLPTNLNDLLHWSHLCCFSFMCIFVWLFRVPTAVFIGLSQSEQLNWMFALCVKVSMISNISVSLSRRSTRNNWK